MMDDVELANAFGWIEKNLLPRGSKLRGIQKIVLCKYFRYSGKRPNFLTVMPTGGGKSVLFQGPALYKSISQKDGQKKLNIVISPLKALMNDQVFKMDGFNDEGVKRIACIHSGTADEDLQNTIESIKLHNLVLLYVAPERVIMKPFFSLLQKQAEMGFISSITFDEAHCVISWGNSFRPDYVTALRKCITLQEIGGNFPIHLLSATIPAKSRLQLVSEIEIPPCNITPNKFDCNMSDGVCNLCHSELGDEKSDDYLSLQQKALEKTFYPINEKIKLSCREVKGIKENKTSEFYQKLREVYNIVTEDTFYHNLIGPKPASRVIIFTVKRDEAEIGCDWLNEEFISKKEPLAGKVDYFHAQRDDLDKERVKNEYYLGKKTILFATTAFGLGMDIPNIHLVINLAPPLFLEDYLQEVGRAGRNPEFDVEGQSIRAICLYSKCDLNKVEFQDDSNAGESEAIDNSCEITPNKVATAYSRILKYYDSIVGNSEKRPMIPVPSAVILSGKEGRSLNSLPKRKLVESQFRQCLNWLSEKKGLNRIELGFPCQNVFEVSVNKEKDLSRCSEKVKFLYLYANKILESNQELGNHLFIEASELIKEKSSGIENTYEFTKILDECYRKHLFGNEFNMLYIEIRNENAYNCFNERGILPELDEITQALSFDGSSEDLGSSVFSSLMTSINRLKESDFSQIWLFFYYLTELFSPQEINRLCYALYKYIASHIKEEDNNWFRWGTIVDILRQKDSWSAPVRKDINEAQLFRHEIDDDDARLLLLALSFLGYLSVNNKCNDYYEIRIIDNAHIDWSRESDCLVRDRIIEMNNGRYESSLSMKSFVSENRLNKESIIAYSQGQTFELNK